jgi:cob(I)alamin adenosyltransferase
MKIYTRKGDQGQTSIYTGARFKKHSLIINTIGNLDELSSYIGLCRAFFKREKKMNNILHEIQDDLYMVTSNLAGASIDFNVNKVKKIEKNIDEYEKNLSEIKKFIIPSGHKKAMHLHVARTICRRAERKISQINENEGLFSIELMYINRVSDLLFVMARHTNKKNKFKEETVDL